VLLCCAISHQFLAGLASESASAHPMLKHLIAQMEAAVGAAQAAPAPQVVLHRQQPPRDGDPQDEHFQEQLAVCMLCIYALTALCRIVATRVWALLERRWVLDAGAGGAGGC